MFFASAGGIPDPMHHVQDAPHFELFDRLFGGMQVPLLKIGSFQLTKFMVLELLAAVLIVLIYVPMARRVKAGGAPTGGFWNAFESLLTFIRNDVAKPNIGEEEADRFVPYLWTVFLFILFM